MLPSGEQLLVVSRIVLSVETSRQTEVGELDVSAAVEEDVVGLDVTSRRSALVRRGQDLPLTDE